MPINANMEQYDFKFMFIAIENKLQLLLDIDLPNRTFDNHFVFGKKKEKGLMIQKVGDYTNLFIVDRLCLKRE